MPKQSKITAFFTNQTTSRVVQPTVVKVDDSFVPDKGVQPILVFHEKPHLVYEGQEEEVWEPQWANKRDLALEQAKKENMNYEKDSELCIVQRQHPFNGRWQFGVFPTHDMFLDFNNISPKKHFYEVCMTNRPVKLCFDLDFKLSETKYKNVLNTYNGNITPEKVFNRFYSYLKVYMKEQYKISLKSDQLRVLDASNGEKISIHIVVLTYAFKTVTHMVEWYGRFKKEYYKYISETLEVPLVKQDVLCGFDTSIARSNGTLRMIGSSKFGSDRVLVPATYHPLSLNRPLNEFFITNFEDEMVVCKNITYYTNTIPCKQVQTTKNQVDLQPVDLNNMSISKIIETFISKKLNGCFEAQDDFNEKGFMTLTRVQPCPCYFNPDRVHDNRDSYLLLTKTMLSYGCYCDEEESITTIACFGKENKWKSPEHLEPESFTSDKVICSKWIPKYSSTLPIGDILVLKSNMGTGKTFGLREIFGDYKRILIVTFRRTLGRKYIEDFKKDGFKFYLDKSFKGEITGDRIVVQVDSLQKVFGEFDLLFLDEIKYVNQHRLNFPQEKIPISKALIQHIRSSTKVIAADGLMSNAHIDWLKGISGNKTVYTIHNTYERFQDKSCYTYYNRIPGKNLVGNYIDHVLAELDDGNKIVCPVNIKENVGKVLHAGVLDKGYKSLFISADTKKVSPSEWANYDCVIYTPTVVAGLSFEKVYFDKCISYFSNMSCEADIATQMMFRVREVNEYYVYVNETDVGELPTSNEDLDKYIRDKISYVVNLPLDIDYINRDIIRNPEYFLYRDCLRDKHLSKLNFIKVLKQNLITHGIKIKNKRWDTLNDVPADIEKATKKMLALEIDEVVDARYIEEKEAAQIENRIENTRADWMALKNYKLRTLYDVSQVTHELIEDLGETKEIERFKRLKEINGDFEQLLKYNESNCEHNWNSQNFNENEQIYYNTYKEKNCLFLKLVSKMGFEDRHAILNVDDIISNCFKFLSENKNYYGLEGILFDRKDKKFSKNLFNRLYFYLEDFGVKFERCGKGKKKRKIVILDQELYSKHNIQIRPKQVYIRSNDIIDEQSQTNGPPL
jgi:hypothetical protein